MTSRRPRIDWDEALRLHEEEQWNFVEIAREFDYSPATVSRELRKRGARRSSFRPHGRLAIKLLGVWRQMHEKCEKPGHPSYSRFGGRGVRVCGAWGKFAPFYAWARGSGYRRGLVLAIVDERAAFGPFNCRWVTMAERLRAREPFERRKAKRKRPTAIDWREATRLFLEEGLSQPAVARRLGASYTGIISGFKRLGVRRKKEPSPMSTAEGVRLYRIWWSLNARCTNPKARGYSYNGALGAQVAKEWAEFEPFRRWAIAAGSRPGLWLTRIDASRDYSPANCTWASRDEVLRRREPPKHAPAARRPITALGETKALLAWARDPRCPVTAATIARRLNHGWEAKSAITDPPQFPGLSGLVFTELRAFGQVKGPTEWARDKRCRVTLTGLLDRLRRGWPLEEAITTAPFKGVRDRVPEGRPFRRRAAR
jgi:predicted DNA-binding protein (UPF0251 family)